VTDATHEEALRAQIAAAFRVELLAALDGRSSAEAAVRRATDQVLDALDATGPPGRESPAARWARERGVALALMTRLQANGRRRGIPAMAARQLAQDPNDPSEIDRLARRFRRLWAK